MSIFYEQKGDNIEVELPDGMSLADTLDCGQAFRWRKCDGYFEGIADRQYLKIEERDGRLIFHNTSPTAFNGFWRDYFDFERNYTEIKEIFSADETLKNAVSFAGGIRVLHQKPWECICSFIISQNNNIPRIKGIIERLCETFGDKIEGGYTFPEADVIAKLTPEDLAPLRAGFRVKYILDAARKVASREVDLGAILTMSTEDARAELMKIYGVGEKVADCVLLFGYGRVEVIPKDVWIKRALAELFGGELPDFAAPYAGIAQQYLFHYARMTKLEF